VVWLALGFAVFIFMCESASPDDYRPALLSHWGRLITKRFKYITYCV